ncbi:MAG: ATP-binding protein [Vicinamibacterales bacterium]
MASPDVIAAFERRPKLYILAFTASVLLAVYAVQAADLVIKHGQALKDVEARAANLTYVVGQYLRGQFAVADTSLAQLAVHGVRIGGAGADPGAWAPILLSARDALPGSGSISVTTADGVIRHSTNPEIIGQSRASLFIYQTLSRSEKNTLVVDAPFFVPNPPRYIIPIGRRLKTPSGGFDGVVVASVGPEAYRPFFRSLDVGAGGVSWVFHPEGVVVFREPSEENPIGQTAQDSPLFQAARTGAPRNVVTGPMAPGGPLFVSAYHTLTSPPLIVGVSLSRSEALADWGAQLRTTLIVLGALTTTLGGIVFALFRQIDERVRVEGELREVQRLESIHLREANERLEGALEREQRARRETEEAGRLKDEFLMTLSHELRTPLTAIYGWIRMLSTGIVPPEQQGRALAAVERNARAQTKLIEDLLDVSRTISGKLRLDARPINIADVVLKAIDTLEPALTAKNIRLEKALDAGAGAIHADPERVQQIVWNLLSNAIKFTPDGGLVRVSVARADGNVEIAVRDTGIGIAPEFVPFVFERFRQADAGTRRRFGGLGLGLAIVRHLAELHGGSVSVESDGEGQGATFRVLLPTRVVRHAEPAAAVAAPSALPGGAAAARLDGIHALVVDDDQDALDLFASILEMAGAVVTCASSASEALASIETSAIDVLVSDIEMPGQDGYELLALVRETLARSGRSIVSIAVTAYARGIDRQRALDAGFDLHLAKPIEPAELVSAMASMVRRV